MSTALLSRWWPVAACALVVLLAGCGSGGASSSDTVVLAGDFPIAYVKRNNRITMNPTDGATFAPGGDLMLREKSSASAIEYNLTERFTQGKGDASDPEVSYDGKKIVFAMNCPTSNTSTIDGAPACTGRWNIWEYDTTGTTLSGGTFRRITASTEHDDVDPAYLPAGRGYVFASNRQEKSRKTHATGGEYKALDEYEREEVLNIHTMDRNGGSIAQISFNMSHDRNPVVRPNGDIMFSRWEHTGPRNRFAIFRVKPDGTDMFVLYGAQSPGNSFLHPRDMDPAGKYAGFVSSSLMALSRTQEGGSLMFIDALRYSENNTPADSTAKPIGGQTEATEKPLNQDRGLSLNGRITTPFPLWDGSDRVLLSWTPCEVTRAGVVIPCVNLTPEELARLNDDTRTMETIGADAVQDNVPKSYAVYMFDPAKQTWLIVAAPPAGYFYTDPVALQPRAEPHAADATPIDADLAAQDKALIEVRSIYDTDGLERMGEGMLVPSDMPAECSAGIAKRTPIDTLDTRAQIADLARMKDPADLAYRCAPARFVRAIRAVATPAAALGSREAIGETDFEQQQILGYAPVAPDGSFKLVVPADVPIGFSVVDAQGRNIQTHLNWIQVRPGERRTCDGCHSPRRGAAINSGVTVNTVPAALDPTLAAAHLSGETLASTKARLDPTALQLKADLDYTDIWADTRKSGVVAHAPIRVRYTGNASAADDLQTPAPVNGFINYPEHIAPIWTRARGTGGALTCTNCHRDTAKLDLSNTVSGTGRLVSYQELLLGDPLLGANGQPLTQLRDGIPMVMRGPALVETEAGGATGMARSSRLIEILTGQTLKASAASRTTWPTPPATAPDHTTLLNAAEKRLVAEWIDLGGQYVNNPFAGGVRPVTTLTEASFTEKILPILRSTCSSGCHMPGGSGATGSVAPTFHDNRFVLTGSPKGDYNSTLSMISDTCNPASNALLKRPSTIPHPAGAASQATAVLPTTGTAYATIASWIATGCPTP